MSAIAIHADPASAAFARAGEAMLRRMANAQASVVDYTFAGLRRKAADTIGLDGMAVQSRQVWLDVLMSDVAGAPVELVEGQRLTVDGDPYRIVARTELPDLGHVTLQLEPVL